MFVFVLVLDLELALLLDLMLVLVLVLVLGRVCWRLGVGYALRRPLSGASTRQTNATSISDGQVCAREGFSVILPQPPELAIALFAFAAVS